MFLCCHPALVADAQVALTLRLLGGLDTPRRSPGRFLVPEATMAQRIVRAKRKLRDNHAPYRIPRAASCPTGCRPCSRRSRSSSPKGTPGNVGRRPRARRPLDARRSGSAGCSSS